MKLVPQSALIFVMIRPKTSDEARRLERTLSRLAVDDPSFQFETEPTTGDIRLMGQDEHHLDLMVNRLIHEFNLDVEIGAPTVCYRKINGSLHEPIMKLDLQIPPSDAGLVKDDIRSRRGSVLNQKEIAGAIRIKALVPLANLFAYRNSVSAITSGRAAVTLHFDHYAPLPDGNNPDDSPPIAGAMRA